jgi:hypothetical protein
MLLTSERKKNSLDSKVNRHRVWGAVLPEFRNAAQSSWSSSRPGSIYSTRSSLHADQSTKKRQPSLSSTRNNFSDASTIQPSANIVMPSRLVCTITVARSLWSFLSISKASSKELSMFAMFLVCVIVEGALYKICGRTLAIRAENNGVAAFENIVVSQFAPYVSVPITGNPILVDLNNG